MSHSYGSARNTERGLHMTQVSHVKTGSGQICHAQFLYVFYLFVSLNTDKVAKHSVQNKKPLCLPFALQYFGGIIPTSLVNSPSLNTTKNVLP